MSAGSVLLVEEGGTGGVADYTGELAAALARAGWRVEVATATDHGYRPAPGVEVHRLFPYVRGRSSLARSLRRRGLTKPVNGFTHLAATPALLRIARGCDLVHVQGGEWPPLGAFQALCVRAAKRPLVWTPHNTFDRGTRGYARSRALNDRCVSRLVLHSEYDRGVLSESANEKAVVIPHGEYGRLGGRGAARPTPTGEGESAPPGAEAPAGEDLAVLLFGQLRADKGVRDLLEAAAAVNGVGVWLAGEDKGALEEVDDLLRDDRLRGRVHVREGFVEIGAARRLFAAADVVALPYHRASASGVLMLAYGYGRPVIAYPVGGLPEYIVDGETGWLCARADPAALAETLAFVRAAGRERWQKCGAAARKLAEEKYSWDEIAKLTSAVYREVLCPEGPSVGGPRNL